MRLVWQYTETSWRYFPVSLDQQIMKDLQTIFAKNTVVKKKEKKLKIYIILIVSELHSNVINL